MTREAIWKFPSGVQFPDMEWATGIADMQALIERQQDGGMPIELHLLAHDSVAHMRLVELINHNGGTLS